MSLAIAIAFILTYVVAAIVINGLSDQIREIKDELEWRKKTLTRLDQEVDCLKGHHVWITETLQRIPYVQCKYCHLKYENSGACP